MIFDSFLNSLCFFICLLFRVLWGLSLSNLFVSGLIFGLNVAISLLDDFRLLDGSCGLLDGRCGLLSNSRGLHHSVGNRGSSSDWSLGLLS